MYIYIMYMYMCVSIEAADVCLQCTRTMCNIECCRFTTVKESSVCYTYIIQEEALVKGFYTSINIVSHPETTPTCVERVPFCTSGRGVWVQDYRQHTYMHIDHPQCRSIIMGSKWNTAKHVLYTMMPGMYCER